jgi:hypothetical protein
MARTVMADPFSLVFTLPLPTKVLKETDVSIYNAIEI